MKLDVDRPRAPTPVRPGSPQLPQYGTSTYLTPESSRCNRNHGPQQRQCLHSCLPQQKHKRLECNSLGSLSECRICHLKGQLISMFVTHASGAGVCPTHNISCRGQRFASKNYLQPAFNAPCREQDIEYCVKCVVLNLQRIVI